MDRQMFEDAMHTQQIAADLLSRIEEKHREQPLRIIIAACALFYASMCKAHDINIHDSINNLMTFYKNTEVIEEGDDDDSNLH